MELSNDKDLNLFENHINGIIENEICCHCKNVYNVSECSGCQGIIDPFYPDHNKVPSKFTPIINKEEKKKMIVTIIGSLSKHNTMKECKKYWERFGHKVNCPCPLDQNMQEMSLMAIQFLWMDKIEEADLVVAIPKDTHIELKGSTRQVLEFGESTSYEMAFALRLNKQIVIW